MTRFLFAATMTLSVAFLANGQEFKRLKINPDGSQDILIDGVRHLAITRAQIDEWQILKNNYDAAQKINAEQVIQIKELTLERDLARANQALIQQRADSFEKDFNRAREDAARNFSLFQSERELRVEASQFIPHGNKTKLDKILSLFDHPGVQLTIKGFAPVWTALRCSR
jgi:hypothetical protein